MTKDVAGTPDEKEETVNAADGAEAVKKAKQGDMTRYDSIEIKKSKDNSPVRTTPQTTSQVQARSKPMGFESMQYPYNIVLPQSFSPLIESLTKKTTEAIEVTERFSRLHITVPDAKVMKTMVEEIGKKSRGKTKVKGLAGIVHNGITESIR